MSRHCGTLSARLFLQATEAFDVATCRPPADVYRTPAGWLVKFELAGVRLEDITLHLRGHCLTLTGERRDRLSEAGCRYQALEIAYGRFERTVELPEDLEQAPILTEYCAGMLLVHIRTEER